MTTQYLDDIDDCVFGRDVYYCTICYRFFKGDAHTDPETDEDVCENCCPVCSHDKDGE